MILPSCLTFQMGRRWSCGFSSLFSSQMEQDMFWEYFEVFFSSPLSLSVCLSLSLSVWSSHPSLSHLPADEGWAGKSVLDFNQKFPFWVYLHGTEDWPELEDFFQAFSVGHGCAEGRASEHLAAFSGSPCFFNQDTFSVKVELRNVSYKTFSSLVSVTYFDGKLLKREDEKDLTQDG